jgi:hypothetical protein
MDLAPSQTFSAGDPTGLVSEAVELLGVVAYYDHYWSDRWSSSIGYSFTEVDNTNFQTRDSFKKGAYASANLLHYPMDNLLVGAELLWGERTNNDDTSDDAVRFQFTVKYNFGIEL